MSANLYIVPHDFTSVGDAALKYAIFLAQPRKTSILLLHIVSSNDKRTSAKKKLDDIVANYSNPLIKNIEVTTKVVQGSIFEDISKVAQDLEARVIIMGTHGSQGMQKLFGSYAIKVISNSSTPFLIVQDGEVPEKLDNIVVPITTSKESLQVINIAGEIAKTFDSKIHVIAEKQNDQRLNTQLHVRIKLVEQQYEEKGISSEIEIIDEHGSFQKSVVKYVAKNKADLIAISYYTSSLLPQFETFTQNLITNKINVPCLVINAKLLAKFYF